MIRRNQSFTLQQATLESPVLTRLSELTTESAARLKRVEPIIPKALLSGLRPAPIDGAEWCIFVSSNAAAAKLRQLVPALLAHLRSGGIEVNAIRLRIQTSENGKPASS